MSRSVYGREQMAGGIPLFLMDIEWGGRTWLFSEFPVVIPSDIGDLQYTGGLEQFDYKESANFISQDLESNIVSAAVIFDGINLMEEWSKGRVLEGAKANFSYVVFRNGAVEQTHEERIVLLRGRIQEPQFGDPDEVDGYCTLSIEMEPMDENKLLLEGAKRIDNRFQHRDIDTANGKPFPVIIGTPGFTSTSNTFVPYDIYSTPAYCIQTYDFGTSRFDVLMMVAGHLVNDTQVTIQDDSFQSVTKTIQEAVDSKGNQYSYITLTAADQIAVPGFTGTPNYGTSREYWVTAWRGGGMPNPFGDGVLELAGDVCRWALHRSGQKVDDGAWANMSVFLNRYKIAGYVNDSTITAWEWLSGNILPLLPITVRSGPDGLRPVLNELHAISHIIPMLSVKVGDQEEFLQISPVETHRSTGDLINRFTLNFAKGGHDQDYTNHVRVTDVSAVDADILSQYSVLSVSRYGVRSAAMDTDYVYDRRTANMIALGKVRASALPIRSIDISAPFHYGWLQIGDILNVTADSLFLEDHLMMVTGKVWEDGEWRLTLAFEDNPIQNERKK
jgi:hypothetical protein